MAGRYGWPQRRTDDHEVRSAHPAARIAGMLLTVAMVVAMAIVPVTAFAGDDYRTVTDEDVRSGAVNLSATVIVNGEQVHRDFPNVSQVQDVAPGTDYTMTVNVVLEDAKVTNGNPGDSSQFNLNWEYPLPMKYADVTDHAEHVEMDGTQRVGTMQVVEGEDGRAVLRVKFDPAYVRDKHKNTNFFFNYKINARWEKKSQSDAKTERWEFPGLTQDVEITWGTLAITGGKNCWYDSAVPAKDGYLGMKCDVNFTVPEAMKGFHLEDTYDDGVEIVSDTLKVENTKGQDMTLQHDAERRRFTLDMGDILEGSYKITYQQYIKTEGAQVNNDGKYANRTNTVKVRATDHDEREWSYAPHHQHQGGGDAYIQMRKTALGALTHGLIEWEVRVNTGDNKVDVTNYKFKDELHAGSDGRPTQDYVGNAIVYLVNADGTETEVESIALPTDGAQTFEYQFGQSAETRGNHEYVIRYRTRPRENKVDFNNTGKVYECADGQCYEKSNSGASFQIKVGQQDMLSKTAGPNFTATKTPDGKAYVVPWTIDFDPHAGGNTLPVTDLELYEDWVNARSDGNTLHMWYSKDHLDLKVQEACTPSDEGCVEGWKDVTADYKVYQRKGDENRWQDAELPGGTEFPKDAFADDQELHGGMPAFRLVHTNGSNAFKKKLRITYNTLFDGTGDSYMNYAKFQYKIAGQEQKDVVSAYWSWTGANEIGKTMDAEHVGDKDGLWNNNAQWVAKSEQCPNGCWVSHWTVWGNGKKPWWSTVNEYKDDSKYYADQPWMNGIGDLQNVDAISVKDTLPAGWHVDATKGVTGYFVTAPEFSKELGDILPEESADGAGWWKADGRFFDKEWGFKDTREHFKLDGSQWSESDGVATFTIRNDGNTLDFWEVDDEGQWAETASDRKIGKKSRAIVVVEFDTYICAEEAQKQGLHLGGSMTFTNRAEMFFDKESVVPGGTSGTTTVTNGGKNVLNKQRDTWQVTQDNGYENALGAPGELKQKNMLVYRIEMDPGNIDFLDRSSDIELRDELSNPNAEYIGGFGVYYPDPNQSNKVHKIDADIDVNVDTNPETGCQGLTIKLPGSAAFDRQGNRRRLIVTYVVRLKGTEGEYVRVTNKISMSQNVYSQIESGETIVKIEASMGASGSVYAELIKTDTSFANPTRLSGATFAVCEVDTQYPASMTQSPRCVTDTEKNVTTDDAGTVKFFAREQTESDTNTAALYGMKSGVLYAAVETQAPAGYALNALPHYFVLMSESGIGDETKNYITTYKLVVESNGRITVRDEKIVSLSWDKLDFSKATFDEDSGKITGLGDDNRARLVGASWMVQRESCLTKDPTTDPSVPAAQASAMTELPCTFYVRDGGGKADSGTSVWVADEAGEDGVVTISGVRAGERYLVTETEAPEGYVKGTTTYVFAMDEKSQATLVGVWDAASKTMTAISDLAVWRQRNAGWESSGLWAIGNQPMVLLPSAGGRELHLAAFGIAIVAAGMCLAVVGLNRQGRHAV